MGWMKYNAQGALEVNTAASFLGMSDTPSSYNGEAGRVVYVNAGETALAFASNLYWDDGNNRLGILTITPDASIDINPSAGISSMRIRSEDDAAVLVLSVPTATAFDPHVDFRHGVTRVWTVGFDNDDSDALKISNGAVGTNTRMTLLTGGNVGIGTVIPPDQLSVQGASAANVSSSVFAGDGDGTDFVTFLLYGVGTPADTANRERIEVQYDASNTRFRVRSEANGTGTLRPLVIETEGNVGQVFLGTGGNVGINDVGPSRRLQVVDDNADGSIRVPIARLESQVSGGAGAAGHGPSLEFHGETSTTEDQFMAEIAVRWSVATHASRRARAEVRCAYIGTDVLVGVIEAPATASADGNSRGVGAVDFQNYRVIGTNVASGDYSALLGGRANIASGDYSIALGREGVASGDHAAVLGGRANNATIDYSATIGGYYANADKYGQVAHASGRYATAGDAQGTLQFVSRRAVAVHILNNWYSLYLDGASQRMTIAADTAWTFHIIVVGITQNTAQQFGYEITGVIERDNTNNTTLATSTVTTLFESDANYDAQVVADDANEALEVQVRRTGGVDYDIRWVATIRTVEVTYP